MSMQNSEPIVTDVDRDIEHLQAKIRELEAVKAEQQRAYDASEYVRAKKEAAAAARAARQEKLDAWSNGALAGAKDELEAIRAACAAWLVRRDAWLKEIESLNTETAVINGKIEAIAKKLFESVTAEKEKWTGLFESDAVFIDWINEQIDQQIDERVGVGWAEMPTCRNGRSSLYVRTSVQEWLHNHVAFLAQRGDSLVLTRSQMAERAYNARGRESR